MPFFPLYSNSGSSLSSTGPTPAANIDVAVGAKPPTLYAAATGSSSGSRVIGLSPSPFCGFFGSFIGVLVKNVSCFSERSSCTSLPDGSDIFLMSPTKSPRISSSLRMLVSAAAIAAKPQQFPNGFWNLTGVTYEVPSTSLRSYLSGRSAASFIAFLLAALVVKSNGSFDGSPN